MNPFKQLSEQLKNIKVDENLLRENQEKEKIVKTNERLLVINKTCPEIFRAARIKDVDSRIIDFFKSDDLFCWIHGGTGTGKTHSIYALRNSAIIQERPVVKIVKEYDLDYKKTYNGFIAIDDVGLSENDNYSRLLLDIYMNIIDSHLERNEKIIFTSNFYLNTWLKKQSRVNEMTAIRIESRMSNKTKVIELKGSDKRREKKE